MHRTQLRVTYADTDRMGFVYYGHYLRWFEIGRAEMIRSMGMSYLEMEEAGVSLPVVEAQCRYLRPARYDDSIGIETGVADLGRASVAFGYRVLREGEDSPLALGRTEHCFMGRDGRPVRPLAAILDILDRAPRSMVSWTPRAGQSRTSGGGPRAAKARVPRG